jgi:predicted dehydrogenase
MLNKLGIIGFGSIGAKYLELINKVRPNLEVVIVHSRKSLKNKKTKEIFFYSLDEAIDFGINAAIIATPASLHAEQAERLLNSNIHVLIEKPLSDKLENLEKLLKIDKKAKSLSLLGYCLRYDPGATKFKELLLSPNFGKILHVKIDCGSFLPEWRPKQNYTRSVSAIKKLGGGVLLELSHEIDYARWFFGGINGVYATLKNSGILDINVEDSADIIFETKAGFSIAMHLDFNTRKNRRNCHVFTSKGDAFWDYISNEIVWNPKSGIKETISFEHKKDIIYEEQLKHFFNCIEKGIKPLISISDGLEVLKLIDASKVSNKLGKKIQL